MAERAKSGHFSRLFAFFMGFPFHENTIGVLAGNARGERCRGGLLPKRTCLKAGLCVIAIRQEDIFYVSR